MAGKSIASQLQVIKTALNVSSDPEPSKKRPLTRPSVLYDAKFAADTDLHTIFSVALEGLEVLISMEERFRNYKNDLFSFHGKELDRGLVDREENKRLSATVASFLRLLSGYLISHSALKTLEYLIRRYKVHEYNAEDLILCALPYHETPVFVRIIRLIDMGNTRWKFLNGVKESGAPPPREVIVQQCARDMGVLEAICSYATPMKKIQPSQLVTVFCTAIIFEVLGLVTVDSDIFMRIYPYVNYGLQLGAKGQDQKASALMIASKLAQKSALAPNAIKSLLCLVADMARKDAKEGSDLRWLRMSIMAIISIVQFQSLKSIPKKTLDALNEIRDISGILSGLAKEFNIDQFLEVLLESLLAYSDSDDVCHHIFLSMIKTVPMEAFISLIVLRLLATLKNLSQGTRFKQIFGSIFEKYPNESREALCTYLKDEKVEPSYDVICKLIDEYLDASQEIPDPKAFFALEHSEAEVRKSAVLSLGGPNILGEKAASSKEFSAIQDALLRRLYDDDLNVVLAVLNKKDVVELLNSPLLPEAVHYVLRRCIQILLSSSSSASSLLKDVALMCTQRVITNFKDQEQYLTPFATMIFPLLLVRRETWRLNLEALKLAKELRWPFYENLVLLPGLEKKLKDKIYSVNAGNIRELAKTLSLRPVEYMPWLVKCCNSHELSKTLFFFILSESLRMMEIGSGHVFAFFDSCFSILKDEWEMASRGNSAEQSKKRTVDGDWKEILKDLDADASNHHAEILACLFYNLSEAFVATASTDKFVVMKEKWVPVLEDLFIFYACHSGGHSEGVFRKHLESLSKMCEKHQEPLREIMLKLFVGEGTPGAAQIESLHSFSHICSQSDETMTCQLFLQFPSVLVPLSSDDQNVRLAAVSCIKKLNTFWSHLSRNGNSVAKLHFLGDLLRLIIQQERMILSDRNFLPTFFTSLLCSFSDSVVVHPFSSSKRFDEATRDKILEFLLGHALRLPAYAKLKILNLVKGVGSKVLSITGVRLLLIELLESRRLYYSVKDKSCSKLSQSEVDILCLLLECCTRTSTSHDEHDIEEIILKALWFDNSGDSANIEPCMTILRNLSGSLYGEMKIETQELILRNLLFLLRSVNGDIQNSTRDTLLRINLHYSVVVRVLDLIMQRQKSSVTPQHGKKQKKSSKLLYPDYNAAMVDRENTQTPLPLLSALLEVLLIKKDIDKRASLVGPLFELLHKIVNDDWISGASYQDKVLLAPSGVASDTIVYIQQTLLLTLEDISGSLENDTQQKDVVHNFDLQLVVSCARSSSDPITRNHAFSLITTLVKIIPDKVLDRILDILAAAGESTITQWDRYSERVFEGLISALLPCWLSRTNNIDQLLQVFVDVLPQVADQRRFSIITHILRTLGEAESLGSLLFLLFRSLISSHSKLHINGNSLEHLTFVIDKLWEYEFAVILCEQYSCTTWLPSLIITLKKIANDSLSEETSMCLLVAMHFIDSKLRDPEVHNKLMLEETSNEIQTMARDLMEQVVYHLHLMDLKKQIGFPALIKIELKEFIRGVLKTVVKALLPSTYFDVTITLISHVESNVRKKALGLLCETVKDLGTMAKIDKRDPMSSIRGLWQNLNTTSQESFEKLCMEIYTLLDAPDDRSSTSLKLAAVSALEVLADRFPSQNKIFSKCFGSVCRGICSDSTALSSHCLRATGALVNALGQRALPELPSVMVSVFRRSTDVSSADLNYQNTDTSATLSSSEYSIFMSILLTLEAIISKLAVYLNPYLGDILKLVVLNPLSFSPANLKLKLKADVVRKLITEKVPVRLLLPPVLSLYSDAIKSGDSSLLIVFEMLGNLVGSMDKSSVGAYHAKVFDLCLLALDLRHQNPASVMNIDDVEKSVISAVVTLTMKLTETMFRPLFVKTIEWLGINVEGDGNPPGNAISRAISFFCLVNKLAESHRSLFVPYFKYLLDGCVRGLLESGDMNTGLTQKKKKAKLTSKIKDKDGALSLPIWHLRYLILSSLHKSFLYDTGNTKFLGASNFQVLLKPLVSQLVVEPPASIECHPDMPSTKEVDDLLVACVGQMAITAGSDLLWKPLNHEVLMYTRSEKMRARILGLRIIKYLLEKLKEEYLVFLPETIPFLGELLEDVELPVKSLAQEILKEMESMSGESLREYL